MPDLNTGVLGIPDGDWCSFGEPTSAGFTRMEGSFELNTVIRATDTHRDLEDEYIATSGDAAREETVEETRTRVSADEKNIGEVSYKLIDLLETEYGLDEVRTGEARDPWDHGGPLTKAELTVLVEALQKEAADVEVTDEA